MCPLIICSIKIIILDKSLSYYWKKYYIKVWTIVSLWLKHKRGFFWSIWQCVKKFVASNHKTVTQRIKYLVAGIRGGIQELFTKLIMFRSNSIQQRLQTSKRQLPTRTYNLCCDFNFIFAMLKITTIFTSRKFNNVFITHFAV